MRLGILPTGQIESIEGAVLKYLKPIPEYKMLLIVPGIGPVIAWTIVLEAVVPQEMKALLHCE